jgi:hypothetical protein
VYLDKILGNGISQAHLERSLGLSTGYISKLKNKRSGTPRRRQQGREREDGGEIPTNGLFSWSTVSLNCLSHSHTWHRHHRLPAWLPVHEGIPHKDELPMAAEKT